MKHAVIIEAEIIDSRTIKLNESLEGFKGTVEVIIQERDNFPKKKSLIGLAKGKVIMGDNFNDPIEEFKDYTN